MNDLMSGGVHRLWKTAMVDWLNPRPGLKLLDTAGGTGDIAFRVLDRLAPGAGEVIVCDLTAEMLAVGRDRSEEHTSELQSLMRSSYAVFCLKKKRSQTITINTADY